MGGKYFHVFHGRVSLVLLLQSCEAVTWNNAQALPPWALGGGQDLVGTEPKAPRAISIQNSHLCNVSQILGPQGRSPAGIAGEMPKMVGPPVSLK